MWTLKKFKTETAARAWMDANTARYQMTLLFIHNGCAVEYRKLRIIG